LLENESSTLKSGESKKEIVLIFPGKYKSPNPQMPLSLVHKADPLIRAGYSVRILDMRVEDYRGFHLDHPVFVGISSVSGAQIRCGLEIARNELDNPTFRNFHLHANFCSMACQNIIPSWLEAQFNLKMNLNQQGANCSAVFEAFIS